MKALGFMKFVGVNNEFVSKGLLWRAGSASKLFIFKAGALFAIIDLNDPFASTLSPLFELELLPV